MQSAIEGLRLLVIEDNKDSADSLAMLMRLAGFRVVVAYTPHLGMLLAEKEAPDIVLLDIGMPRLDGYEVARSFREREDTQDALIIAVTGYAHESAKSAAEQAGFDLHLAKPVDAQALIQMIKDHPRLAVGTHGE